MLLNGYEGTNMECHEVKFKNVRKKIVNYQRGPIGSVK